MFKRIYVIKVEFSDGTCKNSEDAYTTLEKAQKLIESRGDAPEKITSMKYQGEKCIYFIDELLLK